MVRTPIRTLIVDDHPAMRAGVAAIIGQEPDLMVAGSASGARQLWPTLKRADPDVVLMDFALDGVDGVILCHRLKRQPGAPRVVLYSAFANRGLIAPAMLAQADAFLSKRADARVLCQALRDVVTTPDAVPTMPADAREHLGETLDEDERSLAALLLARRPLEHIADVTGVAPGELDGIIEDMLRRLVAVARNGADG
jgi:DNA-binding NarL/FixJ family response regulator